MSARRTWILAAFAAACSACAASPGDSLSSEDELRVCAGDPSSSPRGIDVSRYQGTVDWSTVRAAGVTFAFARVGDGLGQDVTFTRNWQGMRSAGVRRGAYQYFRPGRSPEDQADKMIAAIGALAPGDLPPVLDLEISDGQSDAVVVRKAVTWLERVKKATGRTPLLYSMSGFINTLSDTSQLKPYPLWIANFDASCPTLPKGFKTWVFWQTSDHGQVQGVSKRVDKDLFGGAAADLGRLAAGDPTLPPPEQAPQGVLPMTWERTGVSDCYTLQTTADDAVDHVEYYADETVLMGSVDRASSATFDATYCFKHRNTKPLEAHGFDSAGRLIAFGMGSIDVTSGTGIYVRKTDQAEFEIGLERPGTNVSAISVAMDGEPLLDAQTMVDPSPRDAVRASIATTGQHTFDVTTFTLRGGHRTDERTVILR